MIENNNQYCDINHTGDGWVAPRTSSGGPWSLWVKPPRPNPRPNGIEDDHKQTLSEFLPFRNQNKQPYLHHVLQILVRLCSFLRSYKRERKPRIEKKEKVEAPWMKLRDSTIGPWGPPALKLSGWRKGRLTGSCREVDRASKREGRR